MKVHFFQCATKSVQRLADGKTVRIKGFASTPNLDRQDDIVLPQAFIKTLNDYKARGGAPALLRQHNTDYVCGKIIMDGEDAPVVSDQGLFITGDVTDTQTAEEAMAGEMQSFSIGYIPLQSDYQMRPTGRIEQDTGQELYTEARILKELDLVEVSIVSTPANPNALFTVQKSLTKFFNSLPSPAMKLKCDVCGNEDACGRVGSRFIGKKCIDQMQFKSDEVIEIPKAPEKEEDKKEDAPVVPPVVPPVEKVEDKPIEPITPKPETPAATPEQPKPEEGAVKGEDVTVEKRIVSKEDKEAISAAAKRFAELDAATDVAVKKADEVKAAEAALEVKDMEVKDLPAILEKVAGVLEKLNARIVSLEAVESSRPIFKGKSIMAFHGHAPEVKSEIDKKEAPKGTSFLDLIKSSKSAPVVIGGDDDEE